MIPEQRIDANIDALLRASGSGIDYHTMPRTLQNMREVMRRIMSDSYIKDRRTISTRWWRRGD